ncbi:radical SAM domain-containing protein [gut metagenome]|uniref:Radical SAM domain-containing protein n=1 Tax=gut metagenome TaxID=749906 RepID=J9GCC4_9ZZZZ
MEDVDGLFYLQERARATAWARFGKGIYVRGLIEVSNYCRNNCYYCGIRSGNILIHRYRLDAESILDCCHYGYSLGFRTFVLQGGEDSRQTDDFIADVVSQIRVQFPDCAITLSLGEKSRAAYERFFQAGANRYLLRHETFHAAHYRQLHPSQMSRDNRLQCLSDLKEIGYQVGTGIMVGSPGQTAFDIAADMYFIQELAPAMIGIGPFIPHHATPFAAEPAGSLQLTLKLISLFRLMHPSALIPATTALATLSPEGRTSGILAGANVVMPNLSPPAERKHYELYDEKAALGAESAEGLALLSEQLAAIGYFIDYGRGDYQAER